MKKKTMNFFKGSEQPLIKINDLEANIRQLKALVTR